MRTVIGIREGENWWGGASASAVCPLTRNSAYREDMIRFTTSASNQAMPLYLSDQGRYIWMDGPCDVSIRDGSFVFEGGSAEVTEAGRTLRDAYLAASAAHFPPDGRKLPDEFFRTAQYNTWMEFTYYPTQEGILEYARDYIAHGYVPGILIIDEGWQKQYGTWDFDRTRFPDPKAMSCELHKMGFKLMLWIVPYIRCDGVEFVRSIRPLVGTDPQEAEHLYIRNTDHEVAAAKWWNGYSALLDMTNPYDADFLDRQLRRLMDEYGIDGFKFDGGSVDGYSPESFINGEARLGGTPHELNQAWNRFGLKYSFHEFKDSYGMGGHNAIQRLRDKGHEWTADGIASLIPSAAIAGLIGHPFICPDMVGGGEWSYRFLPGFDADPELFVRMAQCSCLFPMIQFSWAPWTVLNEEEQSYCLAAAKLHSRMEDEIVSLVRESEKTGEPILRLLEYNDPGKGYARITDEFMLGRDILAAPVVTKGTFERNVVFPEGNWIDEDGNIYPGGTEKVLPAPLGKLLWFKRI